jgi:hypothetical protein
VRRWSSSTKSSAQARAHAGEVVVLERAEEVDERAGHAVAAAREVALEELRARRFALVGVEQDERAQPSRGIDLGDPEALDLERRGAGGLAPDDAMEREPVACGGDEPRFGNRAGLPRRNSFARSHPRRRPQHRPSCAVVEAKSRSPAERRHRRSMPAGCS